MQSLIVSPLIFYTLLVLNSFTAGYLLVRSLTFSEKSKLIKYILFSLGLLFAIAVGGAFKAPGFIMFTGNAEKEATQILWLFANALIGIIVAIDFFTGKVPAMLKNILFYAGYAFGLWAIYVVFGGILEFGAYATVILFFVICIGLGVATALHYYKVSDDLKLHKKLTYIFGGLVFAIISLNAFDDYTLVRETPYTEEAGGWEVGITTQQDKLKN